MSAYFGWGRNSRMAFFQWHLGQQDVRDHVFLDASIQRPPKPEWGAPTIW